MKAPDPVTEARQAARRGEVEVAIAALRRCAEQGDNGACASLAELLAFRGEWVECIPNAGRLIANPGAVYAGNVFDDMIRLLGCAGRETGQWTEIERLAATARASVDRAVTRPHLRKRYFTILDRLRAYARGGGAPPHELIAIFQPPSWLSLISAV